MQIAIRCRSEDLELFKNGDNILNRDTTSLVHLQNPFIIKCIYLRSLEPSQGNHVYAMWLCDQEIRCFQA